MYIVHDALFKFYCLLSQVFFDHVQHLYTFRIVAFIFIFAYRAQMYSLLEYTALCKTAWIILFTLKKLVIIY